MGIFEQWCTMTTNSRGAAGSAAAGVRRLSMIGDAPDSGVHRSKSQRWGAGGNTDHLSVTSPSAASRWSGCVWGRRCSETVPCERLKEQSVALLKVATA